MPNPPGTNPSPSPHSGRPGLKITAAERPNTLGLNQQELETLAQKLESMEGKNKAPVRREFSRWPYRQATVKVTLLQPGGTEVHLKLACRNLSRGGISLLHNQFVHPGSVVHVGLPRLAGGTKMVPGTVKRCLHKRGVLHELGVQFDEQVDLKEFLGGGKGAEFFSLEHVDPEKLTGQVLYVEDCDVDYRIFQHFLRETGISLHRVGTAGEAMRDAVKGYDVIITDWRLPDMQGTELVEKLRASGIETPAILITADPVGLMRAGVWDLPGTGILTKPLSQTQLIRALAERMLLNAGEEQEEGKASGLSISGQGHVPEVFVEQYARMADQIQKALDANDMVSVADLCMQIRGSAICTGAPQLGRFAEQALAAMGGHNNQELVRRVVAELVGSCRNLKAAA